MDASIVTSMSKSYYDCIGKIMVDSFSNTWKDYTLTIYSEDDLELNLPNINVVDINKACNPNLQEYLNYIGNHRSRGFTYKVFAWIDAVRKSNNDWILWIDADCACIRSPDERLADILFPENKICSYMKTIMYKDKTGWKDRENCDSAVISFNKKTTYSTQFLNEFERLYTSFEIDNRKIYPKPNDTHAFIKCINDAKLNGVESHNLNNNLESLSPINHIELGNYFRHFKANRKDKQKIEAIVNKLISSTNKFSHNPDKLAKKIERLDRKLRNA